jgi:hypothetical protein
MADVVDRRMNFIVCVAYSINSVVVNCMYFVVYRKVMDVLLKHAFICTVAGPTSSGKTWFYNNDH